MVKFCVTPDGKILGLTNFIGKNIFIIDQEKKDLEKETRMKPIEFDLSKKVDKRVYDRVIEICEKQNLDFNDFIDKLIENYKMKTSSKKGGKK